MANPVQQGLKRVVKAKWTNERLGAEMANPVQQGLKPKIRIELYFRDVAEMANPVQQGLKLRCARIPVTALRAPKWLIQYNKD